MRDPGDRPNTTRYARGGGRVPTSTMKAKTTPRNKADGQPKDEAVPALSTAEQRRMVAEKLAGFGSVTWDWVQIQEHTVSTIQEILAVRSVPPEALSTPRLDIAVPAIEAMRYSALKREFALLIAATMDAETCDDAHPSFIEILKQLTHDEVRMIGALPDVGQVLPFANINYLDRSGRIMSSLRYVVPDHLARSCERRRALGGYIDNLLRLNLVAAPSHLTISDDRYYRELLHQEFITEHQSKIPPNLKPSVDKKVLAITDFGHLFRKCCLDPAVSGRPPEKWSSV
jgi:hypothetical protein